MFVHLCMIITHSIIISFGDNCVAQALEKSKLFHNEKNMLNTFDESSKFVTLMTFK
jgi:hypothetical protein